MRHTHATLALPGERPPQGRQRAARSRHRLDHAGYLLARHPGDAGGEGALIAGLVFAEG